MHRPLYFRFMSGILSKKKGKSGVAISSLTNPKTLQSKTIAATQGSRNKGLIVNKLG